MRKIFFCVNLESSVVNLESLETVPLLEQFADDCKFQQHLMIRSNGMRAMLSALSAVVTISLGIKIKGNLVRLELVLVRGVLLSLSITLLLCH